MFNENYKEQRLQSYDKFLKKTQIIQRLLRILRSKAKLAVPCITCVSMRVCFTNSER